MDPISLAIQGVGLGMQIFGGMKQADDAKQAAAISRDEAMQEQNISGVKRQQMELEARRSQMQNIRNIQRARAMAINASVNQGAQFGSGIGGGLGQISGEGNFNMLGVDSALQSGRQISGYNDVISQDKMKMSSVQSQMASDAGWASLGGALMKSGGTIGNLAGSIGSSAGSSIFSAANSGGMLFQ